MANQRNWMVRNLVMSVCIGLSAFHVAARSLQQTPLPDATEYCPYIYSPVCGVDDKTYSNSCFAKNAGVQVACHSACPCTPGDTGIPDGRPVVCPLIYSPVCSSNGTTYGNECVAEAAGEQVACQGECPCGEESPCPLIYQPVCGANGQTYSNQCVASNANTAIACYHECPCAGNDDGVFCDMMYDPVCDAFNTTYGNACVADSVNATIVCDGECPC